MILGIFVKNRQTRIEDGRLDVNIDGLEAIYAVITLSSEVPRVCFEDYMTAASIILKRNEKNMIILEFEDFSPPGRIREVRLISDVLTISVTLEEREIDEIAEGFRQYQPPEDFLSYIKRNMKKSENPLVVGNIEQISS